jgi:hypothetical protein
LFSPLAHGNPLGYFFVSCFRSRFRQHQNRFPEFDHFFANLFPMIAVVFDPRVVCRIVGQVRDFFVRTFNALDERDFAANPR